ncbi:MAG: glucosyltransferase domain-containing protein [Pseudobutyrivibrio sp.]|nr:glucosyltransferase domain-containing protein [Pseudobutyrivibrio sp.]
MSESNDLLAKLKYDNSKIIEILLFVIVGVIIHGAQLFDKTIWFDDSCSILGTTVEASISHGRWSWAIVDYILKKIAGTEQSIVLYSIIAFLFIALIANRIFKRFGINSAYIKAGVALYMLSNITVLGNLGYAGSIWVNFVGLYICTVATEYIFDGIVERTIKKIIIGMLLLTIAIGVYQCYFAYYITYVLVLFVEYIIKVEGKSIKRYFTQGFATIVVSIVSLILYFVVTNIICYISEVPLTDYANTSSYGIVGLIEYLQRIVFAYKDFIIQRTGKMYSIFPFVWSGWWYMLLALSVVCSICIIWQFIHSKDFSKILPLIFVMLCFPLGENLIFVMYDEISAHALHRYQSIFIFIYLIVVIKNLRFDNLFKKIARFLAIALVIIIDILLVKYDNTCYSSIKLAKEQGINYANRLITSIQMQEGYTEGMTIKGINISNMDLYSVDKSAFSSLVQTNPYNSTVFSYTVNEFIRLYVDGTFYIREMEESEYDIYQVYDMPVYPSEGAIKIVDGTVVVRF